MTPSVETPSVETGGRPRLRLGRRAGAPSAATGDGLVARTAPAAAIRCGRFRCGLDNLAKLFRPVHFENPSPVVAEPQPLTDRVAPDDRLDAFHGMRCRCGIQAGGLTGGILANPIVKLCRRFDNHSRIIHGPGGQRAPTVETLRFAFPNCPSGPPIVETSEKPEEKIIGLTRPVPMLSLGHRGQRSPDRGNE